MSKGLKIALVIITILVGLLGMAYWGANIIENQKEIERLEAQSQQEQSEIQQLQQQLNQLKK